MVKFEYNNAVIVDENTVKDGNGVVLTKEDKGSLYFGLVRGRINNGGVLTRKSITQAEFKTMLKSLKTPFTRKWFKYYFGSKGYRITKTAIKEIANRFDTFNCVEMLNRLTKNKGKTITSDLVLISMGIETESTRKKIQLEKEKQERKEIRDLAQKEKIEANLEKQRLLLIKIQENIKANELKKNNI